MPQNTKLVTSCSLCNSLRITFAMLFLFVFLSWCSVCCYRLFPNVDLFDSPVEILITSIIVFIIILIRLFYTPRKIEHEGDCLSIKLWGRTVSITKEEILKVCPYPQHTGRYWTFFRGGGIFAMIGNCKHSDIGTFTAYVTDLSRSYVIYHKSGRPIVVSADDATVFKDF